MKLLNNFSGVLAIFFPVGKLEDGGTCEFASEVCIQNCAAFKNTTKKNKIPLKDKEKTFQYFKNESILTICNKIVEELKENNLNILYWFASGDCPREITDKITTIINLLNEIGIVQCGFTRNEQLKKQINIKVQIVLTCEHMRWVNDWPVGSLFAIPNFETGKLKIYIKREFTYKIHDCGMPYFKKKVKNEEIEINIENNCQECYNNKKGCFTNS